MRILFASATRFELSPFFENLKEVPGNGGSIFYYKWNGIDIDHITTGLGTTFTAYSLVKALQLCMYDLVINAGIAGSFSEKIPIGTVVNVKSEQIGDFGIEKEDRISTVFESGFADANEFPFTNGQLINPWSIDTITLQNVKGFTSNISHGTSQSIARIRKEFDPDIESMEGAAAFYVCLMEKVPFLEIRAISNYVEVRDTNKWDIPGAIRNLADELLKILTGLADSADCDQIKSNP
ncbi:MAG: futalosine hydrolase [Mariniphaga sp.]